MIITDHIINIHPIGTDTSLKECIELMMDHQCFQLPVEKEGLLYGTVDLDECIHSQEDTIESVVDPGFLSTHFNTHIFEVLELMHQTDADVCSVLDENKAWIGLLTKSDLVQTLSKSLTVGQNGAIIIVEMASHQYSASEISRLVEGEGSHLLGLWLQNVPDSGRIRASLKLNTKNAERIISGLQRHNYDVVATFGDDDYKDNVEKRFESFMKYIDL